jgi:hypothetical protein
MTIDMSNNRVPYGLLTDEEKAALHEHKKAGGKFLYASITQSWRGTNKPEWMLNTVYRTVPLPKTQDVIAWDRLPDWVEWVARDRSGDVAVYEDMPIVEDAYWTSLHDERRIDDFPGIVVQIGTVDWQDSKQRRPRG